MSTNRDRRRRPAKITTSSLATTTTSTTITSRKPRTTGWAQGTTMDQPWTNEITPRLPTDVSIENSYDSSIVYSTEASSITPTSVALTSDTMALILGVAVGATVVSVVLVIALVVHLCRRRKFKVRSKFSILYRRYFGVSSISQSIGECTTFKVETYKTRATTQGWDVAQSAGSPPGNLDKAETVICVPIYANLNHIILTKSSDQDQSDVQGNKNIGDSTHLPKSQTALTGANENLGTSGLSDRCLATSMPDTPVGYVALYDVVSDQNSEKQSLETQPKAYGQYQTPGSEGAVYYSQAKDYNSRQIDFNCDSQSHKPDLIKSVLSQAEKDPSLANVKDSKGHKGPGQDNENSHDKIHKKKSNKKPKKGGSSLHYANVSFVSGPHQRSSLPELSGEVPGYVNIKCQMPEKPHYSLPVYDMHDLNIHSHNNRNITFVPTSRDSSDNNNDDYIQLDYAGEKNV